MRRRDKRRRKWCLSLCTHGPRGSRRAWRCSRRRRSPRRGPCGAQASVFYRMAVQAQGQAVPLPLPLQHRSQRHRDGSRMAERQRKRNEKALSLSLPLQNHNQRQRKTEEQETEEQAPAGRAASTTQPAGTASCRGAASPDDRTTKALSFSHEGCGETRQRLRLIATKAVETHTGQGGVSAAKAVETQGPGLAATAVETRGKGGGAPPSTGSRGRRPR